MSDPSDKPDENEPNEGEPVPADPAESLGEVPKDFAGSETAGLVTAAQSGDAQALNELFARYRQTMVEMARRRLGPRLRLKEDPDDLAQTTFREATRDFSSYTYRGEASLLRWLMQILQNKIRDKAEFYSAGKRDLSRERDMEGAPSPSSDDSQRIEPPSPDLSVTMQVAKSENIDLLRQAISELSEEHRSAITLVFFRGLTLRQAGEQMGGKSEDAVRMMLRRAEAKLGDMLKSSVGKDLGDLPKSTE